MSVNLRNGSTTYGLVARSLHWLTVAMVLFLIGWGLYMTRLETGSFAQFEAYQLHKSVGLTLLLIMLFRAIWRRFDPPPALPEFVPPAEQRLARWGHLAMYALLILQPLIGWAAVSASPLNLGIEIFGVIPWPTITPLAAAANREELMEVFELLHRINAILLSVLIVAHIAAVVRHEMLHGRRMLVRMGLPARRAIGAEG